MVAEQKRDLSREEIAEVSQAQPIREALPQRLEGQLSAALESQVALHADGHPFTTSELLRQYPDLAGHTEAELCLAYQEISLQPGNPNAAANVKAAYPHLTHDLNRQIEFARALAMYSHGRVAKNAQTVRTLSRSDSNSIHSPVFPTPGQIGRFTIERLVGHGGMGVVFCAHDTLLHRRVAIKIPKTDLLDAEELDSRLVREARIAAQLRHPNLAELYEVAEFEGGHYLVSRWANGGNLQQYLARRNTPVPEQAALQLLAGIAAGLAHCHERNVTHLDLKPGNILFDSEGTGERDETESASDRIFPGKPILTDFGVARVLDPGLTLSCTHTGVGTPLYMAPEQIEGRQELIGPASDIFALGLILHELLGGVHPLAEQPISRAFRQLANADIPKLPSALSISISTQRLLARCLQPNHKDRYPDASSLLNDLQQIQRGEILAPGTWAPYTRLRAWSQREEAIDQTAYMNMGLNLGLGFGFSLMFMSVAFGWSDAFIGSAQDMAVDALKLFAFPHAPLIIVGYLILRGYKRLHLASTLLTAVLNLMIIVAIRSGISPIRIYHDQPFAHYLLHISIFAVCFGSLVAHLLALPAWLRLRKHST